MKINSDLVIKNSLSGNETNYAPSINAVKTKTDSIDTNINTINNSISTINTALDNRLRCVARGDLFGTIAGNKSVDIAYNTLGMTGNSSIYLICCAGANIAWRNVCIVSTHSSQINSVNTIMESMMTCTKSSAGKLTVKNTNSTYSVTPDVRVYLLASRQQY